jgi:hypothetical protein
LKKVFYPRIFFPIIKLIFFVGFLVLLFHCIIILYENFIANINFDLIVPALIFILFIGFFTFQFGYVFCFYFKRVSLIDNKISIFELNKLKIAKFNVDEILGFSKSEVYFGRYAWKSKSLVIYFKSGKTSEILSSFVSGVDVLEKELKNRKVKYLGFEDYNTGWFFREYKFNK